MKLHKEKAFYIAGLGVIIIRAFCDFANWRKCDKYVGTWCPLSLKLHTDSLGNTEKEFGDGGNPKADVGMGTARMVTQNSETWLMTGAECATRR